MPIYIKKVKEVKYCYIVASTSQVIDPSRETNKGYLDRGAFKRFVLPQAEAEILEPWRPATEAEVALLGGDVHKTDSDAEFNYEYD